RRWKAVKDLAATILKPCNATRTWCWRMPKWPNCAGRDSRRVPVRILIFPVERFFLHRVSVTGEQNQKERNHRTKNQVPRGGIFKQVLVNHGPGIKEPPRDIEEDKQHGPEMKLDGETGIPFADRVGAAFVGGVFG